ncbi:hypothetical protein DEO72_LG10g2279 [Vigna unguiculata]|uniref:Uncharacterized protein n=1 Tax=Vigna unguiculata TaxID=3917 RepID=A0A4D6NBG5_VIGUN|nr:hypothetical protein DEO72_LG10g2279 [Vigna unguiculata]
MNIVKNTRKSTKKFSSVGWMFCSQIHEHREEPKKRFMSTVKNTKKDGCLLSDS